MSNSIFIVLFPFSDFESIFLTPSAPPITSSITCVTSSSIIGADADLYSTLICTTGGCRPEGSSLTGNCQKTKIPNRTKIRDITHATTGLLILTSVIYIVYFFIGFILPIGMTFFKPSATIKSPSIKPEIISTFPLFLDLNLISLLFAILSLDTLYT